MVKSCIDPALKPGFEIDEIHYHAPWVERLSAEFYFDAGVVAMEKAAFPVIVQETVTVAEVYFFRNSMHV